MFSRMFDRAGPLWRAANSIGDIIVVNVLLVLTLLPVVTAGAGFTAAYDTARRVLADEDQGAARTFWISFRANFRAAGALWAVIGPLGALIAASWIFVRIDELLILKVLVTWVYLLIFPFVWTMQARFENTVGRTLRNAVIIAVARLPYAVGVLVIQGVIAAVTVATWIVLPQIVVVLLLLGYALAVFAATPLLQRTIAVLMPAEPAAADDA